MDSPQTSSIFISLRSVIPSWLLPHESNKRFKFAILITVGFAAVVATKLFLSSTFGHLYSFDDEEQMLKANKVQNKKSSDSQSRRKKPKKVDNEINCDQCNQKLPRNKIMSHKALLSIRDHQMQKLEL